MRNFLRLPIECRTNVVRKPATFTKVNTPPFLFFTLFKLYKGYQIAQRMTYLSSEFDLQKSPVMNPISNRNFFYITTLKLKLFYPLNPGYIYTKGIVSIKFLSSFYVVM